jgi:hypothetical protein
MRWLRRLWIIIRVLAVLAIFAVVGFVLWAIFIENAMERGI